MQLDLAIQDISRRDKILLEMYCMVQLMATKDKERDSCAKRQLLVIIHKMFNGQHWHGKSFLALFQLLVFMASSIVVFLESFTVQPLVSAATASLVLPLLSPSEFTNDIATCESMSRLEKTLNDKS
ncbi:CLUMA_CG017750, isoform A [Clunio marinus]|uniref:CLUMA_CG017722, isoform A n=1 Tax=Clunio marinus TaxID=568069 RepID=A0A1J1IY76_9DIPT|nr:CLUMA_CG017722, isoform A [Clunio marinus]CRL04686.1 CLUMA_CG017750, isoform A [Clunio marinus]